MKDYGLKECTQVSLVFYGSRCPENKIDFILGASLKQMFYITLFYFTLTVGLSVQSIGESGSAYAEGKTKIVILFLVF